MADNTVALQMALADARDEVTRLRDVLERIASNELCHAGCPRDAREALRAPGPSTEKR